MTKFKLCKQVSLTNFEDSSILLDLNKSTYYALNASASEIIKTLELTESISQAVEQISTIYDIDPQKVQLDIDNLITELNKLKLIQLI